MDCTVWPNIESGIYSENSWDVFLCFYYKIWIILGDGELDFFKKFDTSCLQDPLTFSSFAHLLQFLSNQHTKNKKMKFYSQFLDSAPSVSALGGSRGPRRYQGWPQNFGHCPRIGYKTSFLNFYYANLAKTGKMGQNSQKQDDKKLCKPQKPPKRGSFMVILHKYSKKMP